MAYTHGKNSVFKVDNSGGTLTDISAYLDNVDFPISVETAETTTFGDSAKDYIVGLKDATVSISGVWDATPDAHLAGILGQAATVTVEWSPAGTSSGNPKYTAEAILTSYSIPSSVGDKVTFSAEFQVSGAVTRGTH